MNPYYDPRANSNQYSPLENSKSGNYTPPVNNYQPAQNGYYYQNGYYVAPPAYQQQPTKEQMQQYLYYKQLRSKETTDIIIKGFALGATIIAYLIIQTIIVLVMQSMGYMDLYNSSPLFQNCFNIVAVHICSMAIPFSVMAYALRNKSAKPLVPSKKVPFPKMISWIFVGLGVSMAANFITNFVINIFKQGGYELTQPELAKANNLPAYVALVFSTAIVPAVFEEYAFRCCTLSAFRKHGKAFAVLAVSIVFGLVHGNLIQFVFAFIVGAILTYITIKTDSVVPAMFVHGLNNSLSVVSDIVTAEVNKNTADTVIGVMAGVYIAGAIAGAVYLYFKKDLLFEKTGAYKNPLELSLGKKLLCLLPGLCIPFAVIIAMSTQYITKIK